MTSFSLLSMEERHEILTQQSIEWDKFLEERREVKRKELAREQSARLPKMRDEPMDREPVSMLDDMRKVWREQDERASRELKRGEWDEENEVRKRIYFIQVLRLCIATRKTVTTHMA